MQGPITKDTLLAQIPSHILESYPNFVTFLEAYYEWISQEGNPYERIRDHMSYLDFTKSIDAYIDAMKDEYLVDVPDSVLLDKELFIKWSKKFNIARGSHYSYKFLFKLLYNEQTTDIYLPKENILRTSDGVWIDNEFRLLITNSGTIQDYQLARIVQEREPFPGVFEYAYANVQSVKNKYAGGYNLIELTVSDIEGEFKQGYPIKPEGTDKEEWLLPTVGSFNITSGGTGYREGIKVDFDESLDPYTVQIQAQKDGIVDSRVSGFFNESQLVVRLNGSNLSDFTYDGRNIVSDLIQSGDQVEIDFPPYEGYIIVDCTCTSDVQTVQELSILDAPIGIVGTYDLTINDTIGSGFEGEAIGSQYPSPITGYYQDNSGHLSSNMYLQDSFYYQEYSYAIQTQQSIEQYGDIVKEVLHPAGFALFGYLRIIEVIELIIGLVESDYSILPFETESRAKYSLGPNYSFFDRFKHGLSGRLYNMSHFQDKPWVDPVIEPRVYMDDDIISNLDNYVLSNYYKPSYSYRYDMEMALGNESEYIIDGVIQDDDTYVESTEYNLEDDSLTKTLVYGVGGYYDSNYIQSGYFNDKGNWVVNVKGWMTKHYLQDYFLYIPQDYSQEVESANNYFETGYVSERTK